jgi:LAO/AO transport system kinase
VNSKEHYIFSLLKIWTPTLRPAAHYQMDPWSLANNRRILELTKGNDYFYKKRSEQNEYWLMETINEKQTIFYNAL